VQKGLVAFMPGAPADELAGYLDAAVAAALRQWAEGLGGTVRLPSSRWRAEGYTGAVLVAIVLDLPGPKSDKVIVKIHRGDRYAHETGTHARAIEDSPRPFADRHLVRQLYPRYPVRDGRFLMFQDIAGGSLLDSRPMSELPAKDLVEACGAVARALLEEWNTSAQPPTKAVTISTYLKMELVALDEDESVMRWGNAMGLLDAGCDPITTAEDSGSRPMPNPYLLVSGQASASEALIDFLYGRSHGDLHMDNVLVPRGPSGRPQPKEFHLIDLSAYSQSASLTRDPVMLMLSVVSKDLPKSQDQRNALINFILAPKPPKQAPLELTLELTHAVWTIYAPGLRHAGRWRSEWRAQYLLSVLSTALLYTSFDSVGPEGQWYFFRLAARAGSAFIEERHIAISPTAPRRVDPPSVGSSGAWTITVAHEGLQSEDPPTIVTPDSPAVATTPSPESGPWLSVVVSTSEAMTLIARAQRLRQSAMVLRGWILEISEQHEEEQNDWVWILPDLDGELARVRDQLDEIRAWVTQNENEAPTFELRYMLGLVGDVEHSLGPVGDVEHRFGQLLRDVQLLQASPGQPWPWQEFERVGLALVDLLERICTELEAPTSDPGSSGPG
jgi:hypothetical protein